MERALSHEIVISGYKSSANPTFAPRSMHIIEPYYGNEITHKTPLALTAELLKIPPSTDLPFAAIDAGHTPLLKTSLRRLSMEPYYKGSSRRNTATDKSSLSSYALLSDVFDYHYIDQYRLGEHENAIASDSDTDYEEMEERQIMSGSKLGAANTPDLHSDLDSDADSELEDYKVHFLMFKVNSRAQFTRPPRTSVSTTSDWFDAYTPTNDFSLMSTYLHPKFSAPEMTSKHMVVEPLDDSVESILTKYEVQCCHPLENVDSRSQNAGKQAHVPQVGALGVSDEYCGALARKTASDAYESEKIEYFI